MPRGFEAKPYAKSAAHLDGTARKSLVYAQFAKFNLITKD
jgi:hypothetical protein